MLENEIIRDLLTDSVSKITPGIDNILKILALLDNPQDKYKVIHVTGTNGKGSTVSFITTGLIHSGYNVGTFISPHIYDINETILLNNQAIADLDLTVAYSIVKRIANQHLIQLSPFELLTTIMFYYFAQVGIDYLVLEVGMGGLLDATNVVDSVIAIITNISLEHSQFLGNSLEDIARHKAGIIKPKSQVILGSNQPELLNAVRQKTENFVNIFNDFQFNVNLDKLNFTTNINLSPVSDIKDNILLSNHAYSYSLKLFGEFQAKNFLCAYAAMRKLNISDESITYAASNTNLLYRLQLKSINHNEPLVIFDAAHNVDGAKQLYMSLSNMFHKDDILIITSILKDKDISGMLDYYSKLADSVIFTTITNTDRALSGYDLSSIALNSSVNNSLNGVNSNNIDNNGANSNIKSVNVDNNTNWFKFIKVIDDPNLALNYAKTLSKKIILVTGSFYLLSYFK